VLFLSVAKSLIMWQMMNAMAESEPLKKWVEMDYARDNACA
jgi:hypothetical protein